MDVFTYLGKHRMSRNQLAELIGIRPETLYRNLNGSIFPTIQTAIAVEKATNRQIRVEDFLLSCWKVYKEKHKID